MAREKHKRRKSRGESTEAEHWDGPIRISDEGPVMGTGAKGSGSGGRICETTGKQDDVDEYDRQAVYDGWVCLMGAV